MDNYMNALIMLADELTDAIADGYLPAARRLGQRVVLLTDQAEAFRAHFARHPRQRPDDIVECDVADSLHVIGALTRRRQSLSGLFTDSPRLQTCAAVAAEYLHLPGKDWHVTYRASDAGEMHARLRELGLEWGDGGGDADPQARLHHLVTLGDGRELRPLGAAHLEQMEAVLRIVREFGIGLGICTTRYAATRHGPRILDISYCGLAGREAFGLQEQLGMPLFETVLRLHMGEPLPAFQRPQNAAGLNLATLRRWAAGKAQVFS